ncbi:hypothetical protein K435DRAFT_870896 [Dendrothele bispora CBS 962.96]|uniref:Uncharacterized protein n=1 Tax=Dendrothele bispora (strain CBS 962.96) TaxID=1314807 RepID=A0A4S8L5G6_DENBC|nr:hypothetical protein K435DRAFT_870896 [Dendrothele bispora CBS 962.96]
MGQNSQTTEQGFVERFSGWNGSKSHSRSSMSSTSTSATRVIPARLGFKELGEVAHRAKEWEARNIKVIGISANGLEEHNK